MNPRLLQSEALSALSIPHAFSTRMGGFSVGPFSSLNFGNPSDLPSDLRDPTSNIQANLKLVAQALSTEHRQFVQVHQIHGGDVHQVHTGHPAHPAPNDTKADAIVTDDPARLLVIRVADCVPVLITTTDGSIVAAAHAGWRGVIANVVPRAIDAMLAMGAPAPSALVAAIGPCIGPDAFEVGPDVAAAFHARFGPKTPHVKPAVTPGKHLVDLKAALCEQLILAGIPIVDVLPQCTVTTRDEATNLPLFFSHRRDRGHTGRMIAAIGPRVR